MGVAILTTEDNFVDAGESSRYTVTFQDFDGSDIAKAALQSLLLDIVSDDGTAIVSNRDVLDDNGGTVASDGTLTLLVGPTDNAFQGGDHKTRENHTFELTWTWTDGSNTPTGKHKWEVTVRRPPQE